VVDALVDRFGDGITGTWRVPGEFGQRVTITKENTTLFASDRDMFVFLADEENRIELRHPPVRVAATVHDLQVVDSVPRDPTESAAQCDRDASPRDPHQAPQRCTDGHRLDAPHCRGP
jgi:hypothetical protein